MGQQIMESKLERPPTVGCAIKCKGNKDQSSILDHISAFVLGSAFGFVVGVFCRNRKAFMIKSIEYGGDK